MQISYPSIPPFMPPFPQTNKYKPIQRQINQIRNQQNQQFQPKMSKHSNIQSQNIQASLSHRNHPAHPSLPHSEHPHLSPPSPQKEWIATYLDGQYFLTDPESINKLKNIEAEIEIERNRLAKLDQENLSNNNSFLSYQEEIAERQSNKSFCNTEFNQSRMFDKQEKVKNDLEKEEELYREKIRNTEREKIELKKNVKLTEKKQSEKKEGEKKAESRKESVNKEAKEGEVVVEASPSKKMSRKASQEEKEKSYHKSRIQKSIKDNLLLNEEIINQSPEKSVKLTEEKVKSSKPVSVKASSKYQVVVLQPPKDEKTQQVEIDMKKKEQINENHSEVKAKSITDKQSKQGSVKGSEKVIEKLSEAPSPSRKSKAVSIFNEPLIENKSVTKEVSVRQDAQSNKNEVTVNKEEGSIKKSEHNEIIMDQKSQKSNARSNAPLLNIQANDAKSQRKSQRSIQKSVKVSQKPQQILNNSEVHSPSRKSKASSIIHEAIAIDSKSAAKEIQINDHQSHKSSVLAKEEINDHQSEKIVVIHKQQKLLGAQLIENRSERKQKSVSQHSKQLSVRGSEKKTEKLNESEAPSPSRKSKAASIINEPQVIENKEQIVDIQSAKRSVQSINEVSMKKSAVVGNQIEQKSQKSAVKSHVPSIHSNKKVEASDIQSEKKVQAVPQPLKESSVKGSQKASEISNKSPSRSPSRRSKASSVANEIIVNDSKSITKQVEINDQQSNKSSVKESPKSVKSQLSQRQQEVKMEASNQSISMKKKEDSVAYSKPESVKGSAKGSVKGSQMAIENKSIQIQDQSEKSSSYIVNNEASMNESSHLKLQILNNELKPSVQDAAPQINMKKKEEYYENQSEKKSKSFVIHSKQGSVKDRSQRHNDLHNSKASSKSKDYSIMNESSVAGNQSVTKEEILKLHEQIAILQLKLQKVEEKQQQMERFEGTISKIHQPQIEEPMPRVIQSPILDQPRVETPIVFEILPQASAPSKIHPRLQIESSIIQVNTIEQMKKKQEKQSEHNEKSKLKDEISRLKKIIRDMQIQKIKSIDHEAVQPSSPLLKFDGKDSREIDRDSRIEMESINSFKGAPTQRRFFGSSNKRLLEDAGKIVHNSSNFIDKPVETPRRRSIQKMKFAGSEDDVVQDPIELPNESNNKKTKNKFYSEVRKSQLVGRIGDKEKDFHNFIESSRVIAQESNKLEPIEPNNAPLKNFSKISVIQDVNPSLSKINYSRMVQEMKKNNPEEQEILPQIHLRDIKMPNLPQCPNTNMTQQELLNLAKATYLVFGINVDEQDKQLCVKKYKNCVIFTLNNQHHECILWHFSGKFYMGGWRTGEPGQGEKDGQGLEFIPDKHVYKGQFLNGKKNGTGILKLTNGNIYDGQWIEGVKNGRGVYLDSATRVIYSGQWRDGKKQGQGYLKLSQKEYYYGTFVKSIKEGFGVEVFVNGDKYKGEYKNGKFHGKGKYLWANGSCYQGQFNEGVRHGQGSWKSAKVNGDIYIGTYDTDKKNGYGRYVWANGCMYQGGFSNDVKHGKGRLTYQDGKEIKGVWEEGNLMSTESDKKPVEHEDQPLRRSVKVSTFGYPTSAKRI